MSTVSYEDSSTTRRLLECLDAIERSEPTVQAWEYLDRAQAIGEAKASDERRADLALTGLVLGVKDIFDTKDMPTCLGSALHFDRRPVMDAAVVTRLREHGAIILGKTVTTEFACQQPSRTHNPVNPHYTPGGSSSGSAAAVAAGMAHAALGTQTIGSVIRPASYCGVFGFKPSYGRISRAGVFNLSSTLDTVGLFARDLSDLVKVYQVLSGTRFAFDMKSAGSAPRFALCKGAIFERANRDAIAALDVYVDQLRRQGFSVDEVELPDSFDSIGHAARTIHDFEVGQRFITERAICPEKLSAYIHAILDRADSISSDDYATALRFGEASRPEYDRFLDRWDAVISLSATGEAPQGLTSTGDAVMSAAWTFLHVPCLSLPEMRGENQLPIGVQLIASRYSDPALLRAAGFLSSGSPISG